MKPEQHALMSHSTNVSRLSDATAGSWGGVRSGSHRRVGWKTPDLGRCHWAHSGGWAWRCQQWVAPRGRRRCRVRPPYGVLPRHKIWKWHKRWSSVISETFGKVKLVSLQLKLSESCEKLIKTEPYKKLALHLFRTTSLFKSKMILLCKRNVLERQKKRHHNM